MPSATGGFHEVLTKSLNELRTLLAAEHDLVVGELQRRLLYLECNAQAAETTEAEVDGPRRVSAKHNKTSPDRSSLFSNDAPLIRNIRSEEVGRGSGVRQFIRSAMRKRAKAEAMKRSQGGDAADRTSQISGGEAAANEMGRSSLVSRPSSRPSSRTSVLPVAHSNTWSQSIQPVWPAGTTITDLGFNSAFSEGAQPRQNGPALSEIPQPRRLSRDGQNGLAMLEGPRREDEAGLSQLARTDHQFPADLSLAQRLSALAASNPEITAAVNATASLPDAARTPSLSDRYGLSSGDAGCATCDRCGCAYLPDSKFCKKCGKRRPDDQICSCGNIFAPDAIFCRHCGKYRGLSKDSDDSQEEEEENLFQLDAVAPMSRRMTDEQANIRQSDLHLVVTPAMSLPVPETSTSMAVGSQVDFSKTSPAAAGAASGVSGNGNGKDWGRAEDPKMPGKLRSRRQKAIRKNKDGQEEEGNNSPQSSTSQQRAGKDIMQRTSTQSSEYYDQNKVQTISSDCQDRGSFVSDESKKKDAPESARARGRRRDKTKERLLGSRSRSPNAAPKSAMKKDIGSSEGELSDTDSESTPKKLKQRARRKSVMKAQTTPDLRIRSKCSADDTSDHSTPSEERERASAVNPGMTSTVSLTPRKSLPVRFSTQRKLSRVQADADEQSNVTPPAQPQAEKPQPPPEDAPPLPVANQPCGQGDNTLVIDQAGARAINFVPQLPDTRGSLSQSMSFQAGRNNGSLLGIPGLSSGGAGMIQGSFLTHMHSVQSNGSFMGVATGSGNAASEFDDGDMFELLGVWNMQLFRKSMRVQKRDHGDVEEDMDDDDSDIFRNEVGDKEDGMTVETLITKIVMQPSSVPHLLWEMVGLVLIMWDVITIPLDVYEPTRTEVIDFMSWFLRIFWLLDLIISFMTGYLQDQGTLEMRPVKIAKHYLRTWFFPDLICVSLDWATVVLQSVSNLRGLRIVRAVRLFRLLKAPEIEAFISEHIHSDNVILTGNIIKSIILLMGAAHIIACVWYMVGQEASDPGAEGWVRFHDLSHSELQDRYMWSLQWALGQFTGENVYEPRNMSMSERTYAVLVLILTFLFSAMFVSSITTSVTQLQLTKSSTATQLTTLRRYLVDADISTSLAVRVLRNAQHLVNEQKRNVPEGRIELLAVVSEPLRAELHFEVHGRVLRQHFFFDCYTAINPQGIRKVCHMAICSSHVSRGDIIFSDLETPAWPRMFFTVSGKLQYKQVESKPQILQRDQWAGEAVLWTLWMHVGTLRALGESDILAVEAEKFQHIISPFPTNHAYLYSKTFVECLNTIDDDALTDLDAKMVEPYLKYIFPEKFHDHEASAPEETRISGAVLASLSQTHQRSSDYEENARFKGRSRTDPLQ